MIRLLTDEENNIITDCIANVIAKDINSKSSNKTEAIYLNFYRVEKVDYIDIRIVKQESPENKEIQIIPCQVKDIVIRKIEEICCNYSYGLMHYRERQNARDLLNGDIIIDTDDEYYQHLAELANRFGYKKYTNNVTFEPPLKVKKFK